MAKYTAAAKAAEKSGNSGAAEKLYRQAATEAMKDPKAQADLVAFCLRTAGALPGAFAPLKTLLALAPKSVEAHRLAAQAYYLIGDTAEGETHARTAVTLAPKDPEAHYIYAYILHRNGDAETALNEAEAALRLAPGHRHAAQTKVQVLVSLGRLEEAATACRAVIAAYPDDITAYGLYSGTGKIKQDDPIFRDLHDRILPLVAKAAPYKTEAALLVAAKFALDQGDHAAAFGYHAKAKSANPAAPNMPAYRRFVDAQITGISKSDFFGWQASGDDRPVFVVGMPRSGSTLLEQILSGHASVGGIGESSLMTDAARRLGLTDHDGPKMVTAVKRIAPDQARALAAAYSSALDQMQPGALRVVDKFLHNYERLGLIAKMFPKARFIHALRGPMDNCVSCYMANLSKWHSYTQDLTSLGQYYVQHRRLMDHWRKVLPNPILEVRYEDVVADTEGQARRIIDFLGLDWDPNCLKFQENENKARTLSAWQVRQPIYTSSVKRWKKYEEFLGPLKTELAGFYPEGF